MLKESDSYKWEYIYQRAKGKGLKCYHDEHILKIGLRFKIIIKEHVYFGETKWSWRLVQGKDYSKDFSHGSELHMYGIGIQMEFTTLEAAKSNSIKMVRAFIKPLVTKLFKEIDAR